MTRYWLYIRRRNDPVQGLLNDGFSVGSLDEAKRVGKMESQQRTMNRSDTIKIYREIKTVYPDDFRSLGMRAEFEKYLKDHGYIYMDLKVLIPVGEVWENGKYFSYKSNRASYIDLKKKKH